MSAILPQRGRSTSSSQFLFHVSSWQNAVNAKQRRWNYREKVISPGLRGRITTDASKNDEFSDHRTTAGRRIFE